MFIGMFSLYIEVFTTHRERMLTERKSDFREIVEHKVS